MQTQQHVIALVKAGKTSAVTKKLKHGGDPNECDAKKWTPLHWASQEGWMDIVRCLLRAGAEVNAADDLGFTPLAVAAGEGNAKIVRELLQAGASAKTQFRTSEGGTVLHLACSWKRTQVGKLLIDLSDVEINEKDGSGKTPLAYALEAGDKVLAAYLRRRGAVV
jgi:ankyrin repeat protein